MCQEGAACLGLVESVQGFSFFLPEMVVHLLMMAENSWTAQMVSHLDSLPFLNAATAVGCVGKLLYFS